MEKDKTKIFQSILLDPLTSGVLTIEHTREMIEELLQANSIYLKDYQ